MNLYDENFLTCMSDWQLKWNPTRIFRIGDIRFEEQFNTSFFYPMYDGVYINNKHLDANAEVYIHHDVVNFHESTDEEIINYIKNVYQKTDPGFSSYDITDERRDFYKNIKMALGNDVKFLPIFEELKGFEYNDVYYEDERMLLNLLRSYYKCRILER